MLSSAEILCNERSYSTGSERQIYCVKYNLVAIALNYCSYQQRRIFLLRTLSSGHAIMFRDFWEYNSVLIYHEINFISQRRAMYFKYLTFLLEDCTGKHCSAHMRGVVFISGSQCLNLNGKLTAQNIVKAIDQELEKAEKKKKI